MRRITWGNSRSSSRCRVSWERTHLACMFFNEVMKGGSMNLPGFSGYALLMEILRAMGLTRARSENSDQRKRGRRWKIEDGKSKGQARSIRDSLSSRSPLRLILCHSRFADRFLTPSRRLLFGALLAALLLPPGGAPAGQEFGRAPGGGCGSPCTNRSPLHCSAKQRSPRTEHPGSDHGWSGSNY